MLRKRLILTGAFSALAATAIFPSTASAQVSACVTLKAGAGYTAQMRVGTGNTWTSWSDTFPIGKEKCIKLDTITALKAGTIFSVQIKARSGSTAYCRPADQKYDPTLTSSLLYIATGSVGRVHCNQPS